MKIIISLLFVLFNFFNSNAFSMIESHNLYGVQFKCSNQEDSYRLIEDLRKEFKHLNLSPIIKIEENVENHNVQFYLNRTLYSNIETTQIKKDFNLSTDKVYLPTLKKYLFVASKKEIILALSYPGRLTQIDSCNIKDLQEHVGIRQNIV